MIPDSRADLAANRLNPEFSSFPTQLRVLGLILRGIFGEEPPRAMKRPLAIAALTSLGFGLAGLYTITAQAQDRSAPLVDCRRPVPLMPVGGSDPEVVKRVSAPSLLLTRNNWNTDFVVPSNQSFTSFRVNLFFKNSGNYETEMFLKYGDDSNDQFYNERIVAEANQLVQTPAYPRRRPGQTIQPFQVNVKVGNPGSIGNVYVVSVDACR